jgi:ribosomal protein L31E
MIEVAVATLSGKTYYDLVKELKRRNIPFLTISPNDPIPPSIKVIITSPGERQLIRRSNVLTYEGDLVVIDKALEIIRGGYSNMVIGIDPGKRVGVVIMADGRVVEGKVEVDIGKALDGVLEVLSRSHASTKLVRIGNAIEKRWLEDFMKKLPPKVKVEIVSEERTTGRKRASHISSATKIALREGREVRKRA